MLDKLMMIAVFGTTVASVYGVSMLATPGRGVMKVLERTASGAALCFLCYLLLSPLGIRIPQNPFSALCAGYFGLPGVAFYTFVSLWP